MNELFKRRKSNYLACNLMNLALQIHKQIKTKGGERR